jgi:branched-chain amino acid transport system ATP-binding protein
VSDDAILVLDDVGRRYGELRAVDGVSLTIRRGVRHALIGPNGAGKSTLFALITGVVKPTSGRIEFAGTTVTRMSDFRRTKLGMGRTFQHSSLFDGLTARENVAMAAQQKRGYARKPFAPVSRFRDADERGSELLELVGLGGFDELLVGSLSHGHRRQLEVAVALATEPTLLLMDEPTAGMSRDEAKRFLTIIGALPESLTIMLVEHDMDIVFGLASEISVLDAGKLLITGPPEEIRDSAVVQEAYLGPGERMEQLFHA